MFTLRTVPRSLPRSALSQVRFASVQSDGKEAAKQIRNTPIKGPAEGLKGNSPKVAKPETVPGQVYMPDTTEVEIDENLKIVSTRLEELG